MRSERQKVWEISLPVRYLSVQCEDCGNARRLSSDRLRTLQLPERQSLDEIGPRFFCHACRADGRPGRNIRLSPVLRQGYAMDL